MPYVINVTKTGTAGDDFITVPDSALDTTTSLTLVGKNVSNYGKIIMQDLVDLLQNFAGTSEPNGPLDGQLWYDTTVGGLKVYFNNEFKVISTIVSTAIEPTTTTLVGDFWWDTVNTVLKLWDGSQWVSIGPSTFAGSSAAADTIVDTDNIARNVVKILVSSTTVAIFSLLEFVPKTTYLGFPIIKKGMTIATDYNAYTGGNLEVSGSVTATALDINSDSIRLRTAKTPSSANDTGTVGDICWDEDYVYICIATDTWKRAELSTWP